MKFPTDGATLNDANDMERICERYRRLYAALIYDVLEHMGYPAQAVSHRLTPLDRDMKLAGPAFTVKGTMSILLKIAYPSPTFGLQFAARKSLWVGSNSSKS